MLDREEGKSVLTVIDGKVQVRPITVQKEVGTDAFVSAGLTGSEAIIIGEQVVTAQAGRRSGSQIMSAVEIRNVTKIFKKESTEIVALGETNLSIEQGAFVCLMGPSGSGKSTLLNLIAGIDHSSSGQIIVGDTDISQLRERELRPGAITPWDLFFRPSTSFPC